MAEAGVLREVKSANSEAASVPNQTGEVKTIEVGEGVSDEKAAATDAVVEVEHTENLDTENQNENEQTVQTLMRQHLLCIHKN